MISEESYRLVTGDDLSRYTKKEWFSKEAKIVNSTECFIPEKYIIKELDNRKFWRLKLDELLEDFNFERVHRVMKELNWTWVTTNNLVPEKEDMIDTVKNLYTSIETEILSRQFAYGSSGGFTLRFNPEDELSLVFEAESYCVYGD